MKKQLTDKEKLKIAKDFYLSAPFTTKVYMVLKTKLDIAFVSNNWDKIIK